MVGGLILALFGFMALAAQHGAVTADSAIGLLLLIAGSWIATL